MKTNKPIMPSFDNDGLPVFSLTPLRRKYRNIFIKKIMRGEIKLEAVTVCLCGNDTFINISNKDRFGLPFKTKICKYCSLIITDPRISGDSISKYYKEIYYPLVLNIEPGNTLDNIVSELQGEKIYNWLKPL